MNKDQIIKEIEKYFEKLQDKYYKLDEKEYKKGDKHCYSCGLQMAKWDIMKKLKKLL